MKITLKALVSVLAIASLIIYTGCGGGSDPAPSIEDQQLEKLSGTWSVSSVTLGSVDKTADYKTPNFQLVISGTAGATIFSYSTSGRPTTSPWKLNGTYVFGGDPEKQIIRDYDSTKPDSDPVNIDKLPTTYSVSADGKTLQLNFTFAGPGYQSARTSNVGGDWVFTFTKQ